MAAIRTTAPAISTTASGCRRRRPRPRWTVAGCSSRVAVIAAMPGRGYPPSVAARRPQRVGDGLRLRARVFELEREIGDRREEGGGGVVVGVGSRDGGEVTV